MRPTRCMSRPTVLIGCACHSRVGQGSQQRILNRCWRASATYRPTDPHRADSPASRSWPRRKYTQNDFSLPSQPSKPSSGCSSFRDKPRVVAIGHRDQAAGRRFGGSSVLPSISG
ncbi:hypothetical protein OH76DRAFT_963698 [Lentinus brumalis]|uniref:Uncharacterized protein n=1 Tax=Lentinus brumalis TaxID=2498619 RepID=A0A371DPJ5_9APHY|nr:hypothetical protein OH76DRAFT_963698 [Polyporus brumalis]